MARNDGSPYSRTTGGKRPDLGNLYLRSAWEANYARYLNFLMAHGEIQSWAYEEKTFEFKGIKRGSRFYTPDFRVTNKDGSVEYHEVKGYLDAIGATKIKRMGRYFPEVRLILIRQKEYAALARSLRGLIPEWEWNAKHGC